MKEGGWIQVKHRNDNAKDDASADDDHNGDANDSNNGNRKDNDSDNNFKLLEP